MGSRVPVRIQNADREGYQSVIPNAEGVVLGNNTKWQWGRGYQVIIPNADGKSRGYGTSSFLSVTTNPNFQHARTGSY